MDERPAPLHVQLASQLIEFRQKEAEAKAALDEIRAEMYELENTLREEMTQGSVQNFKVGSRTVYLTSRAYVSVVNGSNENVVRWLRDNNRPEAILEVPDKDVLAEIVKGLRMQGIDIDTANPNDRRLLASVNYSVKTSVAVRGR